MATLVQKDWQPLVLGSLGLSPEQGNASVIAQTMDLEMFRDGYQVVLHIRDDDSDLEAYILSCAGMIGLNGINNQGVGICCNALSQLNSCPDGLPVACIVRGVLQQKSEHDAVDFLRQIKHASGQNYLIGGPRGVIDFECSANKVCRFEPGSAYGAIWHTNHPLVSDDLTPGYRAAVETTGADSLNENSRIRLQSLQRRVADLPGESRLDGLKAALSSKDSIQHPICGSKGEEEFYTRIGVFTFGSTIMVLSSEPEFHVTLGPPDRNPYRRLTFS